MKIAAIPRISHEEFLQLLGFLRSTQRQIFYEKIQRYIVSPFDKFWQDNTGILETGLISEGRLDRFFREFAQEYFVKMPDAQKFKNCFYQKHKSVPSKFLSSVKDPVFARKFSESFGQTLAKNGRDPAQYRYVTEENIGDVFYERMVDFLSSNSFFGNHYMHYFFFGEPIKPTLGPDYVRPENYQKLRLLLDRIEVKTRTIEDEIQKPSAKPFTKANLSNIFEYMSAENMTALLQTMSDHMPSGSRIAYWNLLVDRPLPDALRNRFRALTLNVPKDQLWFYKAFHVLERL